MPQTPNHGYNVPTEGTRDWHEPLNENFRRYDTDIEVRDADANRGEYTPVQGAKFLATDTGQVYVGDGSTWVPLPTFGERPTFAALTVDGSVTTTGEWRVVVDSSRALLLTPESEGDAGNVVHGHSSNTVVDGTAGAVIGGGGYDDGSTAESNEVWDDYGTVSGGRNNAVGDTEDLPQGKYGTVGGGRDNYVDGPYATIGGGRENEAIDAREGTVGGGTNNSVTYVAGTIGGGSDNSVSGPAGTVGGGAGNTVLSEYAVVPGGRDNTADGRYSFAAGRLADTNGYGGAFVFGDSTETSIQAENDDEVRSQMPMYAPSFNSTSARAAKTDVDPVDPEAVLAGVESLEVSTWEFADRDDGRHMGPMAGEFDETFGLGTDEESIATVDADGVALAAIQGLSSRLAERDDRIDALETEVEDLTAENEALRDRLAELEGRLASLEDGTDD